MWYNYVERSYKAKQASLLGEIMVNTSAVNILRFSEYEQRSDGIYLKKVHAARYDNDFPGGGVFVPRGVVEIGDYAFTLCEKVTAVTLPEGLKVIGKNAFESNLFTRIVLPNTVNQMGDYAFAYCENLTEITLSRLPEIPSCAFSGCGSLQSITVPDSVRAIGSSAFAGCKSLTEITIPPSVTRIEYSAFERCTALKRAFVPRGAVYDRSSFPPGCTVITK